MTLSVGEKASLTKTITESDVIAFAELTGDRNDAHINIDEAKKNLFGRRVVHGMLVGSLISAVLGTRLPGKGTIYLEQDLRFLKPVFFDDTITAIVEVEELLNENKGIYKLKTYEKNQNDEVVTDGYAIVMFKEWK